MNVFTPSGSPDPDLGSGAVTVRSSLEPEPEVDLSPCLHPNPARLQGCTGGHVAWDETSLQLCFLRWDWRVGEDGLQLSSIPLHPATQSRRIRTTKKTNKELETGTINGWVSWGHGWPRWDHAWPCGARTRGGERMQPFAVLHELTIITSRQIGRARCWCCCLCLY